MKFLSSSSTGPSCDEIIEVKPRDFQPCRKKTDWSKLLVSNINSIGAVIVVPAWSHGRYFRKLRVIIRNWFTKSLSLAPDQFTRITFRNTTFRIVPDWREKWKKHCRIFFGQNPYLDTDKSSSYTLVLTNTHRWQLDQALKSHGGKLNPINKLQIIKWLACITLSISLLFIVHDFSARYSVILGADTLFGYFKVQLLRNQDLNWTLR